MDLLLDIKIVIASFDSDVWFKFWLLDDEFKNNVPLILFIKTFVIFNQNEIIFPFGYKQVTYKKETIINHLTYRAGSIVWYKNNLLHCDWGPCYVDPEGNQIWRKNNILHRIIWADGSQEWYQNYKLHRDDDQPAYIGSYGVQCWYQHGQLHRDGDQPA